MTLLQVASASALLLPLLAAGKSALPPEPRTLPLELGAAWYPEQWPEAHWDADLALMEAAHITFVRVGKFAWSRMEPTEGDYQLDWLERAVRAVEGHHIAVVLGTLRRHILLGSQQSIQRCCVPWRTVGKLGTGAATVRLVESEVSGIGAYDCPKDGGAVQSRPQCHRLAD